MKARLTAVFTGIVEEVGTVVGIKRGQHSATLGVKAEKVLEDLKTGDSVAVNGICLTATTVSSNGFTADVMHETLNRSSLSGLKLGSRVNLERAMPANGRFGGHIVAGHVDGVGTIVKITRDDTAIWYTVKADSSILRYIVEKGSITVDGISLTVARVGESEFFFSAIPHTVSVTVLGQRKVGDTVNLENDIIGKYVEKLLSPKTDSEQSGKSNITREFLSQYGF